MSWRQNYLSVVMVEIIYAPYRFACLGGIVLGYRFLGCPVSFCSGFNISLLIEQPSSLLYNNGNFDPCSYEKLLTWGVIGDYIGDEYRAY